MAAVILLAWSLFAGLGYYVAIQKGRPPAEGLVLGLLFGPLGCLVAALLPGQDRRSKGTAAGGARTPGWSSAEDFDPWIVPVALLVIACAVGVFMRS
jgi:hypothetical protein